MSDKTTQLIAAVRQMIQDKLEKKQAQQGVKQLQNKIDQKNLQIRDIFSQNLNDVIAHYVKYQEVMSNQKRLEFQCQQFSKKIEKYEKLTQYDQTSIQRQEKMLNSIERVRQKLILNRNYVKLVQKVAMNIKEQKYNNAIKTINQMKSSQPQQNSPLNKVLKICIKKITQHLVKLVQSFWDSSVEKQQQIGILCFNKVLHNQRQKANIYQTFFSKNSRNSRNSKIIQGNISSIGLRQSLQQAPMRFLKKIGNQQSQILQRYTVRVKIQMTALKQVKILCGQLSEQIMFKELVVQQMKNMLKRIGQQLVCENQHDFKKMLSRIIGFLLVKRQVVAYFDLKTEDKLFIDKSYQLIRSQIKTILPNFNQSNQENIQDIQKDINQVRDIKQLLDVFNAILKLLDLQKKTKSYTLILQDLFRVFCNLNLYNGQMMISQALKNDNGSLYKTQLHSQQKIFNDILEIPSQQNQYPFTSIIVSLIQIFHKYYDNLYYFIKDSILNKSQLHDHLGMLQQVFINFYGSNLMDRDNVFQIVQGQINLQYSQNILKYYSNQLQFQHVRLNEWCYLQTLQKKLVEMRTKVREITQHKIEQLSFFPQTRPKQIRNQPHDEIRLMMQFVQTLLQQMRSSKTNIHQDIALTSIKKIADLFWQYLYNLQSFNLAFIYDMDKNLLYIYKQCATNFTRYPNISDPFNSLRQFYAFLLTNNINDILIKQKREAQYPYLNIIQIIPILKKYDSNIYKDPKGRVRQLKKKDLDSVVKKLEAQFKQK